MDYFSKQGNGAGCLIPKLSAIKMSEFHLPIEWSEPLVESKEILLNVNFPDQKI